MSKASPLRAAEFFDNPQLLSKEDVELIIEFGKEKGRKIWVPQSILDLMGGEGFLQTGKVTRPQDRKLRRRIAILLKELEEDGVLIRRPEPQSSRMLGGVAYESKDAV
ncbi:MAG: hypothetical protein KJO31_03090 [Gammaproteobacteria bacterium]|nr:hypothetical protein [Gammaproteobacteria bacterium]